MFIMPKSTNSDSFGQRLRQARRDKGITQAQLSELTGISRRAIVHYENYGKRPPVDKLKKLTDAMGISADLLIGASESVKNQGGDVPYNLMKRLRIIEKLPTRDQKAIFRLINSLAEKNKIKAKL